MNQQEEQILRQSIREIIRSVKSKKLNEETQLRKLIQSFLDIELKNLSENVSDTDPTPNKSTGINVLEQLLKKIVPIIEEDYKSLTTDKNQRDSYRAHIVNAVVNTLTPVEINNDAHKGESEGIEDMEEEVSINVGGSDDDKFIDIRTDAEKSADDEEKEADPRDSFGAGVEGDETGRNVAYQSFKKIETNIIDAYELLSNPEDQELFYDYLIANLKLYFKKFEQELEPSVEEPTNKAYDMAAADQPATEPTGDDATELEL
tara:strand:- start:1632 stop:2414 length:783 start_codon:yes stop_codon:yes gene_type:complete